MRKIAFVIAGAVALSLVSGCRKKKLPAAATEGPDDKAKRVTAELRAIVEKREAEVTNCTTIIFDAAKRTIIDPTDYPKKQDPSDASSLAATPVFEALNWKEKKIRQVTTANREKRLFDSPLLDYTTPVCEGLGGRASYLAQFTDFRTWDFARTNKHIDDVEKELVRVKASPPMVSPQRVAFYWHNCDPTPIRTFDSSAGTITVNRYSCKAGLVWLSLPGGVVVASAPGTASALPGKAVSSHTTRAEINAANDDAYDRALDASVSISKAIVTKWKAP